GARGRGPPSRAAPGQAPLGSRGLPGPGARLPLEVREGEVNEGPAGVLAEGVRPAAAVGEAADRLRERRGGQGEGVVPAAEPDLHVPRERGHRVRGPQLQGGVAVAAVDAPDRAGVVEGAEVNGDLVAGVGAADQDVADAREGAVGAAVVRDLELV